MEIQYRRAVRPEGNVAALAMLEEAFEICDGSWRGLGVIPRSGLAIRDKYSRFDAQRAFDIDVRPSDEPAGCLCGEILRGVKTPSDCSSFGKVCTPENPVGPCMVSSEGTCAAHFKYGVRI